MGGATEVTADKEATETANETKETGQAVKVDSDFGTTSAADSETAGAGSKATGDDGEEGMSVKVCGPWVLTSGCNMWHDRVLLTSCGVTCYTNPASFCYACSATAGTRLFCNELCLHQSLHHPSGKAHNRWSCRTR